MKWNVARLVVTIVLVLGVMLACAPVSSTEPVATSTPREPKSPRCEVGTILDPENESYPDFCILKDFGGDQVVYFSLSQRSPRSKISVLNTVGSYADLAYQNYPEDWSASSTVTAMGLIGSVSVTSVSVNKDSDIQKITDITMTSDYIQFDQSCSGQYLVYVVDDKKHGLLVPIVETNAVKNGFVWYMVDAGMITFYARSQSDYLILGSTSFPKSYRDTSSVSFQDGSQNVTATVTNCGGNILGITYRAQ